MTQSDEIPEIALGAIVRPEGQIILCGKLSSIEPFDRLGGDTVLWARWLEPSGEDAGDARIEFAASDGGASHGDAAKVVARSSSLDTEVARKLFAQAEDWGFVDLALVDDELLELPPEKFLERFCPTESSPKKYYWLAAVESLRYKSKLSAILLPPQRTGRGHR